MNCNSSARAIRNPALRALKLAYASRLLIIGRSIPVMNCYVKKVLTYRRFCYNIIKILLEYTKSMRK